MPLQLSKGANITRGKGKGKRGKGGKGYGYKGKGKGDNGSYYNDYRSPGKGVGKGLNHMPDEWYDAWGNEEDYDYYYSNDWYGQGGEQGLGYIGNVAMLLERGGARTRQTNMATIANGKAFSSEAADTNDKAKTTRAKGETETYNTNLHDPLRNTKRSKPVEIPNRSQSLTNDDDDDNNDDQVSEEEVHSKSEGATTTLHSGQRTQGTKKRHNDHHNYNHYDTEIDAAIREAAVSECSGNEWRTVKSTRSELPQSWHPGPEHAGCLKELRRPSARRQWEVNTIQTSSRNGSGDDNDCRRVETLQPTSAIPVLNDNHVWWIVFCLTTLVCTFAQIHIIHRDVDWAFNIVFHIRYDGCHSAFGRMLPSDSSGCNTMFAPKCVRRVGCLMLLYHFFGWL